MGSPESEKGSDNDDRPQHKQVPSFYMGKYPITGEQWRALASLPLDPSEFKGDKLPVENVSWLDSKEFCARISVLTGKEYRLPFEAEWEYAARAGTSTPFYFGDTLTYDLANYNASHTYANEEP